MSASVRKAGSLGHSRRLLLYVVSMGTWLSGGLWLLFHYFFVKQGDFGPQVNPLEPWWLRLHGAFAFAAIWIFGLMWGIHITKTWPGKRRRWSGSILTGLFVWLILTGYLLYYTGDDKLRPIISLLHWVVGVACPAFFLWHRFHFRRMRTREIQFKSQLVETRERI